MLVKGFDSPQAHTMRERQKMKKDLVEENKELKKQLANMAVLLQMLTPTPNAGMVTQRKAKKLFGVTWLKEKDRDAERCGVHLWVRTGGAANSPKRYSLQRLNDILEWEKEYGLPFDFAEMKASAPKL